MDDDVRAMLERLHQVRGRKSIVYDEGYAKLVRNGGDGLNIERVQARIANGLCIDGFGAFIDGGAEVFGIAPIDEAYGDTKFWQGVVEEVVRPTVEAGRGDNFVACPGDIEDGQRLRRLSRGSSQCSDSAFERGDAVFKGGLRRVHDTGI